MNKEEKAIYNRKISDAQLLEECKTLTLTEISEKYGMHYTSVYERCKKLGINPVKKRNQKYDTCEWHVTKDGPFLVDKYTAGKYEFVSYKQGRFRLKCKMCGAVIERNKSTLKHNNIICDCERERREKQKSIQQLYLKLVQVAEYKVDKTCLVCGNTFHSQYQTAKYCSKKCRGKNDKTRNNYRKRSRKYGCEYDHSVNLKKVYERDKGICKICNKPTRWDSKEWLGNFGPEYPTIDHIIPLSRGGAHSWENVQLAHALCNSYKRDLV